MNVVIVSAINYFILTMNLSSDFLVDISTLSYLVSGLLIIMGILGYKFHRVLFSLMVLFTTILLIVLLMRDRYAWLYVATSFSILSVLLAFLAYFVRKLSAFFFIGIIAFAFGVLLNLSFPINVFQAFVVGIIAYKYPFQGIVGITSFVGALELAALFMAESLSLEYGLSLGFFFAICVSIQLLSNLSLTKQMLKLKG